MRLDNRFYSVTISKLQLTLFHPGRFRSIQRHCTPKIGLVINYTSLKVSSGLLSKKYFISDIKSFILITFPQLTSQLIPRILIIKTNYNSEVHSVNVEHQQSIPRFSLCVTPTSLQFNDFSISA